MPAELSNSKLRELQPESIVALIEHDIELWNAAGRFGCKDSSHIDCVANLAKPENIAIFKAGALLIPRPCYKAPAAIMAACQLSRLKGLPFGHLGHDLLIERSALSDASTLLQNLERLPEEICLTGPPTVVKTLTMVVHGGEEKKLVISEAGDAKIDVELLRKISVATGITYNRLRAHAHINSEQFEPVQTLGQEPGNVGPFPHYIRGVDHFFYRRLEAPEFVSVRVMPFYTLCLHREIFEAVAFAHLQMLGHSYHCI